MSSGFETGRGTGEATCACGCSPKGSPCGVGAPYGVSWSRPGCLPLYPAALRARVTLERHRAPDYCWSGWDCTTPARYELGALYGLGAAVSVPNPDAPPEGGGVVTLPTTNIVEPMPGPESVGPGGFPAAPGFRPGNWDFEASTYVLASGDTLSGLARLYLPGEPPRWREIWALNKGRGFTPDKINVGTKLNMPIEARDRAKDLIPSTPSVPSTIGRSVPGAIGQGATADKGLPPAPGSEKAATERKIGPVAIAATAAAVLGLGYLAFRKA